MHLTMQQKLVDYPLKLF